MQRNRIGHHDAPPVRPSRGVPRPPLFSSRIPRPPLTRLRVSLRELLCGQRSTIFIGLMMARLIWVVLQSVRTMRDVHAAIVGGSIFIMAVMIASPYCRFRAPAFGILCGLIWSYALADPSVEGTPALQHWPLVLWIGVLAAIIETVYAHLDPRLSVAPGAFRSRNIRTYTRVALLVHTLGALLFLVPVAIIGAVELSAFDLATHPIWELVPLGLSLPPVVGSGIYGIFIIRRQRELTTMPLAA
jgi:hypothetical protein